jgi:hypothetical protein
MTAPRLLSILLVPLLAMPSAAQRIAPAALRTSDGVPLAATPTASVPSSRARDRAPEPDREPSAAGTVIGGLLGGALGTLAGAMVGSSANTNSGCQGDLCGLTGAAVGVLIGEPLGLAIGAHLGSRSTRHEHLLTTSLASAGILVGGVAAAIGASQTGTAAGAIMIPVIPIVQLITVVAIETH